MSDRTCVEPGCTRLPHPKAGRGMCSPCYQRFRGSHRRAGTTPPPAPSVVARQIRNTPPLVDPGVDAKTEILTKRGWLTYEQVTTDDKAYVLDLDTLTARFEPVLVVNVFPAQPRKLRLLEVGGFSSLSTLSQWWPVRFRRSNGKNRYVHDTEWKTTENLATKKGIHRTLPNVNTPTHRTHSDAFVELVAWAWNEGSFERVGNTARLTISQSWTVNEAKCDQIRAALEAIAPLRYVEYRRPDGYGYFRTYREVTRWFEEVTEQDKAPTLDFVLSLTHSQLHLFIDTCIAGDGHAEANGVRRWMQRSLYSIRRFEMICALAGIPTNTRFKAGERYESHFGGDGYYVSLLRHFVAYPVDSIAELTGGRRKGGRVEAFDELVEHDGIVWCPSTPTDTWLARRNGAVYFTGALS